MKEFGRRGQAKQGAVSTAGHGPSDGLPHPVVGIFLIPSVLGIGYGMGLLGQFQVTNFRTFHVATFFSASIMFGLCCGVTLRSALNPPGQSHVVYRLIYALEAAASVMFLSEFLLSTYAYSLIVRGGAKVEFAFICGMPVCLAALLLFKQMRAER